MDSSVSGGGSQRSEVVGATRSGRQPDGDHSCGCPCFVLLAVAVTMVAAFGVALPVRVTVTDASLSRLDLIATTSNGTVIGSSAAANASSVSIAYNLSLTVHLRNRNWAMKLELAAPLDAELRLAGRRLDVARLADAGTSFYFGRAEEFRVLAASSPARVPLGGAGAAAELARERAQAVFQVELRIAGKVRYRPVHAGRSSRLEVTCLLKMLMPNAPREAHNMVVLQNGVVSCC